MTEATIPRPDHRIILLGASNLTLGLPRIVRSLQKTLPGQVEIISAHGHGRSYLRWSKVVFRGLPSIRDCSLWQHLDTLPEAINTYALVTDLGCDLFYGEKPDQIIESVNQCMARLSAMDARIVFARPPLERLYELSSWQYFVAKNIFFPGPTVPWDIMREYITEVDSGAVEVTDSLGATSLSPKRDWYGVDPIHIMRKKRNEAWREILSRWNLPHDLDVAVPSLMDGLHIWTRKAAQSQMWRTPKILQQPAYRWTDGSTLSVF